MRDVPCHTMKQPAVRFVPFVGLMAWLFTPPYAAPPTPADAQNKEGRRSSNVMMKQPVELPKKGYDPRIIIAWLILPEVLLGVLDKLGVIDMAPPARAATDAVLTTSLPSAAALVGEASASAAAAPGGEYAFAGYAWFLISALAGLKGVADKIAERGRAEQE